MQQRRGRGGGETIRVRAVELLHCTLGVFLAFVNDECDAFRAASAVIDQVEFLDGALTFEKSLFWPLNGEYRPVRRGGAPEVLRVRARSVYSQLSISQRRGDYTHISI